MAKDAAAEGGVRCARQLVQQGEAGRRPFLQFLFRPGVDVREQL